MDTHYTNTIQPAVYTSTCQAESEGRKRWKISTTNFAGELYGNSIECLRESSGYCVSDRRDADEH